MTKVLLCALIVLVCGPVSCIVGDFLGVYPGSDAVFLMLAFCNFWHVQFIGLLLTLRHRLGIVNVQLVRSVRPPVSSDADLEHVVPRAGLPGAPVALEAELRRLQRARLALHRCARLCGRHFGPALLLNVLGSFVTLVNLSFSIALTSRHSEAPVSLIYVIRLALSLWIFVILARLLTFCWACSSTAERALHSEQLMARVQVLLPPRETVNALRLPMDAVQFSACGFFNINMPLFGSFVGGAVAYFVILLQFSEYTFD
ncbi:putative gustatory receptor 2a [Schistocerca gregaria]|uniref:putative gustatory receptor 2a n=1 Tax=Schistocerca gregaria TaxID=7010 RepID=UPI00211E863B|nr:putative gustatory receptor 2a [Schistocerca gregaria]